MTPYLVALLLALGAAPAREPAYTIEAIRYATIPNFPVASLVMDAPRGERLDIAMAVWLVRGEGRVARIR